MSSKENDKDITKLRQQYEREVSNSFARLE